MGCYRGDSVSNSFRPMYKHDDGSGNGGNGNGNWYDNPFGKKVRPIDEVFRNARPVDEVEAAFAARRVRFGIGKGRLESLALQPTS